MSASPERLAISGELTAASVAAQREEILRSFPDGGEVTLDLSAVTEIDAAGLQLLLSARKWAESRGAGFTVTGVEEAVAARLALFGASLPTRGG